MKKWLALFLCLTLSMGVLPASVVAEAVDETQDESIIIIEETPAPAEEEAPVEEEAAAEETPAPVITEEETPAPVEEKVFPWALRLEANGDKTFSASDASGWRVSVSVVDGRESADVKNYTCQWNAAAYEKDQEAASTKLTASVKTNTTSENIGGVSALDGATIQFALKAGQSVTEAYEADCRVDYTLTSKTDPSVTYDAHTVFRIRILPNVRLYAEDAYDMDYTKAINQVTVRVLGLGENPADATWEVAPSDEANDWATAEINTYGADYCTVDVAFTEMRAASFVVSYAVEGGATLEHAFTATPVIDPEISMNTTSKINAAKATSGTTQADVFGLPDAEDIAEFRWTIDTVTEGVATAQLIEGDNLYDGCTIAYALKDDWKTLINPAEFSLKYEYKMAGSADFIARTKTFYVTAVEDAGMPDGITPHDHVISGKVGDTAVVYLPTFTDPSIPLTMDGIDEMLVYDVLSEDQAAPWSMVGYHETDGVKDGYIIKFKKAGRYPTDLIVKYQDVDFTARILLMIGDKTTGVVPDGLDIEGDFAPRMYQSGTESVQAEYRLDGYADRYEGEKCLWSITGKTGSAVNVSIAAQDGAVCTLLFKRAGGAQDTAFTLRCAVGEGGDQVVKEKTVTVSVNSDPNALPTDITPEKTAYEGKTGEAITVKYPALVGEGDYTTLKYDVYLEIEDYDAAVSDFNDDSAAGEFSVTFKKGGRHAAHMVFSAGNFTLRKLIVFTISQSGTVPASGLQMNVKTALTLNNLDPARINCYDTLTADISMNDESGFVDDGYLWTLTRKSGDQASSAFIEDEGGVELRARFQARGVGSDVYVLSYTYLGETVSKNITVKAQQAANPPEGIAMPQETYAVVLGSTLTLPYPNVTGGASGIKSSMTFELYGLYETAQDTGSGWKVTFDKAGRYVLRVEGRLGFNTYAAQCVVNVSENGVVPVAPMLVASDVKKLYLGGAASGAAAEITLANAAVFADVQWTLTGGSDAVRLLIDASGAPGCATVSYELTEDAAPGEMTYTVECTADGVKESKSLSLDILAAPGNMPKSIAMTSVYQGKVGKALSTAPALFGGADAVKATYVFTAACPEAAGFDSWTADEKLYMLFAEPGTYSVRVRAASPAYPNYSFENTVRVIVSGSDMPTLTMDDTLAADVGKEARIGFSFTGGMEGETVSFASADPKIATVTGEGVVKGVKAGTVIVTARTTKSQLTARCLVTVTQRPIKVTLDRTSLTLAHDDAAQTLRATVLPESVAAEYSVSFSSDNEGVVKVSQTGALTPVSVGTANVTATAYPGISAVCVVRVVRFVESIAFTEGNPAFVVAKTSQQLLWRVLPENATDRSVLWTSSQPKYLRVSEDGVVTGVKAYAKPIIVTAAAKDGSGVKATYTIYVTSPATKLILQYNKKTATSIRLPVNAGEKTAQLVATVSPALASKTLRWSSSDPDVADVDQNGLVTAGTKKGNTTITAQTLDGTRIEAKATVEGYIAVTGMTIRGANEVAVKKAVVLTCVPENEADYPAYQWTTSNKKIATVSSAGVVKGEKPGTATITAVSTDGAKAMATFDMTVRAAAKGVALRDEAGQAVTQVLFQRNVEDAPLEMTLRAAVTPSTASQSVTWRVADESIATVDENGVVRATGKTGVTVLTVTTADGSKKSASVPVKVLNVVKTVEIKGADEVAVKKTVLLNATVNDDATDPSVSWTTSNKKIATVSTVGVVKGVKPGTAVIRATAKDGSGVYGEWTVYVKDVTKGIAIRDTEGTLVKDVLFPMNDVGGAREKQLTFTVNPDTASRKAAWFSSDESVATVSPDGLVRAAGGVGVAVVTVRATDGSKKNASVTVRAINVVKEITLTGSPEVAVKKAVRLTAAVNADATQPDIRWETGDKRIATVSADGVVKGVKAGTVMITARAGDGSGILDTKLVAVKARAATSVSVTVVKGSEDMTVGGTKTELAYEVLPAAETVTRLVTWSSSDENVVTVDQNGVVTAIGAGTATVRATAVDGSGKYGALTFRVTAA